MVQVLAVEVMVEVVVLLIVNAFSNSACVSLYRVVLILLLGILRPTMIQADATTFQGRSMWADGASPRCRCHRRVRGYGGQFRRRCGAKGVGKRSSVSGSPAQPASPIRLGLMSAQRPAYAWRPARLEEIGYAINCRLPSPKGPLGNRQSIA